MPHDQLAAALAATRDGRCSDGCDTTRALFPVAIEREVAGHPPDADLYARLERCPACAAEYIAALDLAYSLDADGVDAASAPTLRLPTALRFYRADTEDARRVAEDQAAYGDEEDNETS